MTADAKSISVKAKIEGSSLTTNYDEDNRNAHWKNATIYHCHKGDTLTIVHDSSRPDSMTHDGIVHYDASGNRLQLKDEGWETLPTKAIINEKYLARSLPANAIIGRFFDSTIGKDGGDFVGEPFLVGERVDEIPAEGNILYLAMNDTLGTFYHNSGEIHYNIYSAVNVHVDIKNVGGVWIDVGTIKPGQEIRIDAEGWLPHGTDHFLPDGRRRAGYNPHDNTWGYRDPQIAGETYRVHGKDHRGNDLIAHSLIGHLSTGQTFQIGMNAVIPVDQQASLKLVMNNIPSQPWLVRGSWTVTIITTTR